MKQAFLTLLAAGLLVSCAPWPPETDALNVRAAEVAAPDLLPADQLVRPTSSQIEAEGAALAARTAALRTRAAGL
jgi:hypothetical protein